MQMARFLIQGSYTVDGVRGVLKEGGSGRRKAVESAVKAMGGHLEAFYFALGEDDVVAIVDGLDNITTVTLSMGIAATGTVRVKTTVLLTPEEIDQAAKKTLSFRAAGQ
jgi:uncharacterized protein with GYD domain